MSDSQSKKRRWFSYKSSTIGNLLSDQLTVTIENIGGADGNRTHDLLNAIRFQLVTTAYQERETPRN
jgi:hypothetical protein